MNRVDGAATRAGHVLSRRRERPRRTVHLTPVVRRDPVEDELAAAETAHWRREHDLGAAEAALDAARAELEFFEQQRLTARREKVAAEYRLDEAKAAQRKAIMAVIEARKAMETERV